MQNIHHRIQHAHAFLCKIFVVGGVPLDLISPHFPHFQPSSAPRRHRCSTPTATASWADGCLLRSPVEDCGSYLNNSHGGCWSISCWLHLSRRALPVRLMKRSRRLFLKLSSPVLFVCLVEQDILEPWVAALATGSVMLMLMTLTALLRYSGSSKAVTAQLHSAALQDEERFDFSSGTRAFLFPPKPLAAVCLEALLSACMWGAVPVVLRPGQLRPAFG